MFLSILVSNFKLNMDSEICRQVSNRQYVCQKQIVSTNSDSFFIPLKNIDLKGRLI